MRPFSLFAVLLGICFFQNHAFAQWSVGASLGTGVTFRSWEIHNDDLTHSFDYDPAPGLNAYLLAEGAFGSVFALRAEAGYQIWRNGLELEFTSANGDSRTGGSTHSLHAWSGALLAKISPLRGKTVYLLAGPGVSYLTQSVMAVDKELADMVEVRKVRKSPKDAFLEPLQFFAHVGLGGSFRCGARGRLMVEGRYQLGLSDLALKTDVTSGKIAQAGVQVGYLYGF